MTNVTSMACYRPTPAAHLTPEERLILLVLKDGEGGLWARDGMPVDQIEKQMGRYAARGLYGEGVTLDQIADWQRIYEGSVDVEWLASAGVVTVLPSGNVRRK